MKTYRFIFCLVVLVLFICIIPKTTFTPKTGESHIVDSDIEKTGLFIDELENKIEGENSFISEINSNGFKVVETAYKEIGNIGGEKYWSWYGFDSHVSWCCCFVSWCANECGLIDSGVFPKFSSVEYGKNLFMARNEWQWANEEPKTGMIIFFDFVNKDLDNARDGIPDHVGIVMNVIDGYVYCIEGNYRDTCKETKYELNSSYIFGYGTPDY